MKNILLGTLILFALVSCKASDSTIAVQEKLTLDLVTKSSDLAEKKTFKVIEAKEAPKNTAQLNRIFENKLIENGFSLVEENPDLLVQSVIASVNYENELLGYSNTGNIGLSGYSTPYSPTRTESGKYGKVIFLIQDAKSNEVIWMGTGSGILTDNEVLNTKALKSALDQLMADSR